MPLPSSWDTSASEFVPLVPKQPQRSPWSCTLMALREPLKSMLCEETKVQTGLSCARMVFTFCRF